MSYAQSLRRFVVLLDIGEATKQREIAVDLHVVADDLFAHRALVASAWAPEYIDQAPCVVTRIAACPLVVLFVALVVAYQAIAIILFFDALDEVEATDGPSFGVHVLDTVLLSKAAAPHRAALNDVLDDVACFVPLRHRLKDAFGQALGHSNTVFVDDQAVTLEIQSAEWRLFGALWRGHHEIEHESCRRSANGLVYELRHQLLNLLPVLNLRMQHEWDVVQELARHDRRELRTNWRDQIAVVLDIAFGDFQRWQVGLGIARKTTTNGKVFVDKRSDELVDFVRLDGGVNINWNDTAVGVLGEARFIRVLNEGGLTRVLFFERLIEASGIFVMQDRIAHSTTEHLATALHNRVDHVALGVPLHNLLGLHLL